MKSRASARAMGGKPTFTSSVIPLRALPLRLPPLRPLPVEPTDLRIALFSGNYNYVRDGANQALNRLVDYLLRQGAKVRTYSPTVEAPAFPPNGHVVHVPALPIPGRSEYQMALWLPPSVPRDTRRFRP